MALNFIPTVWAARLLQQLEKVHVYGQTGVVNRDYEGEIRDRGDSVKIATVGDVNVGNYSRNTDMAVQILDDADQMLLIDQAKFFNFTYDDIDNAQQAVNTMDAAMQSAAYKLKDAADSFIAGHYVHAPADTGVGDDTTPLNALAANVAYKLLVDLGTKLDERNVPSDGRSVIVPPFFHGALLQDDRFVKYGGAGQEATLRNGMVGEAAGFRVLKSNNVPNTSATKYKVIALHPMGFSYAEQIVKVESYRVEKQFANGAKGLHVYGGRLVRPQAWAVGTVNNSA